MKLSDSVLLHKNSFTLSMFCRIICGNILYAMLKEGMENEKKNRTSYKIIITFIMQLCYCRNYFKRYTSKRIVINKEYSYRIPPYGK